MQFDDDRVDTSHVDDLRGTRSGGMGGGGMGGAGGAAAAGIIAMLMRGKKGKGLLLGLVILGILLFFGNGLLGGGPTQQAVAPEGASQDLNSWCNQSGAIEQYPDCLLTKAFNETDEVWSAEFTRLGETYTAPRLVFFTQSVSTGCGNATTEVGPFYCPADHKIYFDLGFAKQLQQLGVKGDYANVYIMAHEFGHHLQKILGIEKQVRNLQQSDSRNANKYGIAMELQADCLAGVWGKMANDRGNLTITRSELADAQNAAMAVGDDRIQAGAGMQVNPETWTHGSAEQRQQWYMVGFNSGDMNRCDTFAN